MAQHRHTKLLQFDARTREKIIERDHGMCIFCAMGYPLDGDGGTGIYDIMHFVPKSSMGLGIEENGALGCRQHHHMLDNGGRGLRKDMLARFEAYLRGIYPGWDRDALVYRKYNFKPFGQ